MNREFLQKKIFQEFKDILKLKEEEKEYFVRSCETDNLLQLNFQYM